MAPEEEEFIHEHDMSIQGSGQLFLLSLHLATYRSVRPQCRPAVGIRALALLAR